MKIDFISEPSSSYSGYSKDFDEFTLFVSGSLGLMCVSIGGKAEIYNELFHNNKILKAWFRKTNLKFSRKICFDILVKKFGFDNVLDAVGFLKIEEGKTEAIQETKNEFGQFLDKYGVFNYNTKGRQEMKPKTKPERDSGAGRIVLAIGYPWTLGTGPYQSVQMHHKAISGKAKNLRWPRSLWEDTVGKYRLVLEPVEPSNK